MVVQILKRELELMILQEVIVTGVTIGEHRVHLVVQKPVVDIAAVERALDPHGVGPLQEPGGRIDVTGEGHPKVLNLLGARGVPHAVEENDPLLPQVSHMVEVVRAALHVLMGLVVLGMVFTGSERAVLAAVGKAVPLPIVDAVLLHPIDGHVAKLVHITLVGDVDGAAGAGAIAGLGDDIR